MVPFESLGTVSYSPSIELWSCFRDKARLVESRNFSYTFAFGATVRGSPSEYCTIAKTFGVETLEWCAYPKKVWGYN